MSTSKTLDIIVAGEANVDLILTDVPPLELDKEKLASGMSFTLGGSSSITAFNLARLGARTGFVGVVGDDLLGRYVAERLRWAGVNLDCLRWDRRTASGLTIWLNRGARRAGVTYLGSIQELRAAGVPSAYLKRARHLHVGAYFMQTKLQPGAAALFRRAQRLGLTTSLDCNFDPLEQWDAGIHKVLAVTDVFFPNEDEALRMTGCRKVEEAAWELGQLARVVAVKCGARGAYVFSAGGGFRVPPRRVKVVDTTGAGDSFNAGFLTRFVQGAPLEECARAGAQAGARAVTRHGGTSAFE